VPLESESPLFEAQIREQQCSKSRGSSPVTIASVAERSVSATIWNSSD
jgi:hypothetical protein